ACWVSAERSGRIGGRRGRRGSGGAGRELCSGAGGGPAGSIAAMEPRGIHHLGVAVADLDEAVGTYERLLGARVEHRAAVPEQGVEAASMRVGSGRVELLAALGGETPVGKFLANRGPGMHHVAYEVEDVEAALDELAAG